MSGPMLDPWEMLRLAERTLTDMLSDREDHKNRMCAGYRDRLWELRHQMTLTIRHHEAEAPA